MRFQTFCTYWTLQVGSSDICLVESKLEVSKLVVSTSELTQAAAESLRKSLSTNQHVESVSGYVDVSTDIHALHHLAAYRRRHTGVYMYVGGSLTIMIFIYFLSIRSLRSFFFFWY